MTNEQRRHSEEWRPPWPKNHPESLDWRVSRLEETADHHSDRIDELSARPSIPSAHWVRVACLLCLLLFGLTGHLSPDQVKALALKALGL
jgi:hypothetical protein